LDADGRAIGAVLVTAADGEPPLGGPWLAQLFRDPDPAYAGTGRGLLQAALARLAAAELPALSLAVTDGNPAMHLYEALGFELALSSFSVDL
jgi:predicted N-acetyltransferase YhbS